jgi:allantoicase
MMNPLPPDAPGFTRRYLNLADPRLGAEAISATDDFFGPKERMLAPELPVFIPDKYDEHGKWMDGWETRRKRVAGNDWCIVRLGRADVIALGCPGTIRKVEVDTSHFKGNYPDRCSLQAARVSGGTDDSLISQSMFWLTLLGEQKLEMDRVHYFSSELTDLGPVTHVRFNIITDGGISRLRLWSELT